MKRLTCEMCGSTDLIKENGVFVCQNCGTKYSVEEAKKMMVEGTVEVKGSVKIDNSAALIKRAQIFLSDKKWNKAREYYEKALDENPESSKAYIGLLLAKNKAVNMQELKEKSEYIDISEEDVIKAQRYKDEETASEIYDFVNKLALNRNIEKTKEFFDEIQKKIELAEFIRENVLVTDNRIIALKIDGTVLAAGDNRYDQCNVSGWKDIVKIAASEDTTVGLKGDGTVVSVGNNRFGQCKTESWKHVVDIAATNKGTFAITEEGELLSTRALKGEKAHVRKFFKYNSYNAYDDLNVQADDKKIKSVSSDRIYNKEFHYSVNSDNIKHFFGSYSYITYDGKVINQWHRECLNWCNCVDATSYVGLKNDGTCVAVLNDDEETYAGLEEAAKWRRIIQICQSEQDINTIYIYGITDTGKLIKGGGIPWPLEKGESYSDFDKPFEMRGWNNLISLSNSTNIICGVKRDGTFAVESYNGVESKVKSWKLFDEPEKYVETLRLKREELKTNIKKAIKEDLERERIQEEYKKQTIIAETKKKIENLRIQEEQLNTELKNLKGLFTGKRRKEIENSIIDISLRIQRLEQQIKSLS